MTHVSRESVIKFETASQFTSTIDPDILHDEATLYPCILIATSGCIGEGLDRRDFFVVVCLGFPVSMIDFAQEMGRCGRGRKNDGSEPTDKYHLIGSLRHYVYL